MSKKQLIYIGNKLKARGGNPTSIDVLAPLLQKEGYDVVTASGIKNKALRILHMLSVILKNARSANWVLIDTYSTSNFWYAFSAGRLAHLLGLKYILLLHGGELPKRLQNTPGKTQWLLKNAYLNIAPSAYLKDKFLAAGISGIQYIPNSINLEDYPFKKRKGFQPKLLWVRAFAGIYDPMSAIQTLELLLERYEDAKLCMVGPEKDDSFKECWDYVSKKNLPVTFTGILTKSEWHSLSENYDIFLNTSTVDNTPVSVIEAMALGLPVVSTAVGGIPVLLEDQRTGLLVPANNSPAMANAVEYLLSHPENAKQISISARQEVEKFDWNSVKDLWTEVLS